MGNSRTSSWRERPPLLRADEWELWGSHELVPNDRNEIGTGLSAALRSVRQTFAISRKRPLTSRLTGNQFGLSPHVTTISFPF